MIGIYRLNFDNKLCYIGQSISLNRRKKQHEYCMKKGTHHNTNILKAYNTYGFPKFEILETCNIEDLNTREFYYASIEKLPLLNSAPIIGSSNPELILHHNKKYSKHDIMFAATLLVDKDMEFDTISDLTGINRSTIAAISMGEQHSWLASEIPSIYEKIMSLKGMRQKAKPKKYTNDQIYEILVYLGNRNLTHREISEITEISQTVIQSIAGGYSYTELKNIYPIEYATMLEVSKSRKLKEQVTVISPSGEHFIVSNRSEFARNHSLRKASFLELCNGKKTNYNGWTILDN